MIQYIQGGLLTHNKIRYMDGPVPLTGQLVHDENRGHQRPGILVVHGGAGLDAHAEGRARRLADLGYVAFACDMYGDGMAGDRQRIMACITELRADRERLCRRAQAGIDVLAAHPLVDGRIVAVGYCFGGMAVLELARSGLEVAGVVCVHGSLSTTQPAQSGRIKARMLVCHGALDPHSPAAHVAAFIDEMNRAAADWQLVIYGGAMHGFTHETASGQTPGVLYDARSDARSSAAIQKFLAELF
jgi:dienelactone hydrolase